MIDTICLLVPKYKIVSLQGISKWELYSKTEQYEKFVRNPNKQEKGTGKYFPRLTGYKRGASTEANVRIEFSIPKLIFLNNLDEVTNDNFSRVIQTLQDRLQEMGLIISQSVLINASVSSVHYSKNIPLEDGYTSTYLISEMNKVNLRKSFDFTRAKYTNDGQCLYAHTTAHQLVIYDKVADLNKDKKRAIDKDQTEYQSSLFSKMNNENNLKEILRFEIRLNQKQKLNKVFEGLGYNKNPTFKEIFSEEKSKSVVMDYWNKLIKERNLGLFSISISNKDILQNLFLVNQNLKPKQAVYLLGLFILAKDENGMRQLRTIVSKKSNDRTWYRIAKDVQKVSENLTKNKIRNWVAQIDKTLENYKPYKTTYENNK